MCEHHGGKAWLVIDSAIRRDGVREALFGGAVGLSKHPRAGADLSRARSAANRSRSSRGGSAPTARRCVQSWETYNPRLAQRHDPMGKSRDLLRPLEAPPFYALDISVDKRVFPCAALTLGGLRVDETTDAVKTVDGGTIARTLRGGPRGGRNRVESLRERTRAGRLHLVGPARRPRCGRRGYARPQCQRGSMNEEFRRNYGTR